MRSVSEANRQKQEKKQRNLAQAGRQVRIAGAFLLLIMLLLLSLIWSVCSGSVSVPIMEFLQELREPKLRGMAWTIIWEIRLPRALAALILGGALALSGYLLQTFFHNPIAGPFVLGISSGSKLLVALVMVGFLEWNITINSGMLVAAAFAGALLSMLFVLLVARKMEQMAMLIVGGVMIGYICSAITDFVVTFASDADIVNLHNWSRGSFSGMTRENVAVMAGVTFVSAAAVFLLSKADRRIPDGGDVCEKHGSQCCTTAFLYGDFVQHIIWLRSGICRSGFLCWNRGSASDPLAVCRYKTAGADSGLFPGRKRVLPDQRLAGADGLCPDGIEHQHGNSCLRCAGRDFCDDAETSKEHLKHREAEEKIP